MDKITYNKKWVAENREKVRGYNKKYRDSHRSKVNEAKRIWKAKNPDYAKEYARGYSKKRLFDPKRRAYMKNYGRAWHYKNKFGISQEEVKKLWEKDKKCPICNVEMFFGGRRKDGVAFDHCHKTGKFRGLLCQQCNLGLGLFKDSTEFLKNAIIYLS